ncbi:MAG: UDP-N-acetylmuramoyl-L-alanine--D-glutamate ligase [Akkermansiaceae bacterium]|nr:UDP-N-acetylmuramoyl-L-alanine--D-glutamate ligase [Akkermansiaceae bacterium]
MNLNGKKVAILGCGRSGVAAARLALAKGAAAACIFDINPHASCTDPGISLIPGAGEAEARAFAADLVVISPGIEADSPWTLAFTCAGAPIIGEIELACQFYTGRIIGITGTNGKTTTTALIEHLLLSAGKSAKACGNYGFPFCELALAEPAPEFAVLEVSSFQMETIRSFRPEVAIWLNFAPDHMDRYKKVSDYFEAKFRIFENMGPEQTAIVRVGEALPRIAPRVVEFSAFEGSGLLRYEGGRIMQEEREVIDLRGTAMVQAHNAENTMAAILACRAIGLTDEQFLPFIRSFSPPHYRCEVVTDQGGILWLNDSKSTNLHSTEAALRSQTQPVILIAGGKDKGLDYSPLEPLLRRSVRHCIVFGQIAEQLENTFSPICPTTRVQTVPEAVQAAARHAHAGDVVLFSPGTSSFDQFTGYVQRGQCFHDAVLLTISQ